MIQTRMPFTLSIACKLHSTWISSRSHKFKESERTVREGCPSMSTLVSRARLVTRISLSPFHHVSSFPPFIYSNTLARIETLLCPPDEDTTSAVPNVTASFPQIAHAMQRQRQRHATLRTPSLAIPIFPSSRHFLKCCFLARIVVENATNMP